MNDIDALRAGGFLTYNPRRRRQWTVTPGPATYTRHGGRIEGTRFFEGKPTEEGDLYLEEWSKEEFLEYLELTQRKKSK